MDVGQLQDSKRSAVFFNQSCHFSVIFFFLFNGTTKFFHEPFSFHLFSKVEGVKFTCSCLVVEISNARDFLVGHLIQARCDECGDKQHANHNADEDTKSGCNAVRLCDDLACGVFNIVCTCKHPTNGSRCHCGGYCTAEGHDCAHTA